MLTSSPNRHNKKRGTRWNFIAQSVGYLFVMLFFYTAASKYIDYGTFHHAMQVQPFTPLVRSLVLTLLLPVEFAVGLLLIFVANKIYGLWSAFSLMTIFTIYILLIKFNYFHYQPCSCGGVFNRLSWTQHLYVNIGLILLAVAGIIATKKYESLTKSA